MAASSWIAEGLVGPSATLSRPAVGVLQLGTADLAVLPLTAVAFQALYTEAAAQAVDSLGNSISSQAIDAYFAAEGWLTAARSPLAWATSSNDVGKTALAGIATSLGLVELWAALRVRRRRVESA